MTAPNLDSTAAAEHFFAGAVSAGMTDVIVSPGSRSTPLTVAAHRTPGLRVSVHLDERSAAFAALGQAKASGSPVGLICTSGTAGANYLPALAEASLSNVAVVAVTADRPPEHQHSGVGQSFDQRGLFHRQVREEITMPVGGDGGASFTMRAGWRATATSIERHGPVHVNWAFRLPLEPKSGPIDPPHALDAVHELLRQPTTAHIEALLSSLSSARHPVVIAGPDTLRSPHSRHDRVAILDATDHLGIPVLADALSGLRGVANHSLVHAPSLVVEGALPKPDLVIRLGNTPTAKACRLWWESVDAPQVLVDPLDEWQDPSQMMASRLRCDARLLIEAAGKASEPADASWLGRWRDAGQRAVSIRSDLLENTDTFTEAHVASIIGLAVGDDDTIVASSSMPVRDIDSFTTIGLRASVLSNRGINGIDGVISTAIGVTRASSTGRTVVHVGDVAALHDVGGILDAARQDIPLTIVLPNNDGGGIFSFLPAREALDEETFQSLFHTPHGTTFDFLAQHRGVHHEHVRQGLGDAITNAASRPGVSILEVEVSTPERLALQTRLVEAIRAE